MVYKKNDAVPIYVNAHDFDASHLETTTTDKLESDSGSSFKYINLNILYTNIYVPCYLFYYQQKFWTTFSN